MYYTVPVIMCFQELSDLGILQDSEERAIARATDKDTNERIIGRLLEAKILTLDFGFTAYATNTYIKISQSGMQGEYILALSDRSATCQTGLSVTSGIQQ